ncbi:hypothetical protein [Rhizobium sp. RU36D]|uniref:hypothetical protein n=1 Tax=Rhizobium sp. RU36D TaxID=1907415 RepID=UPI0009D8B98B|nr:hypothetical protein [Rhizobium sp. RU36D]SMD08719.1 hypothetical protein SAMN05880593_12054 [Rhizobium sp. RU36D]
MKTVLVIAAAIGLSTSVASAECMGYNKVTASVDVDREIKTASISKVPLVPAEQAMLSKKDSKTDVPVEAAE